jgi:hypothetical protein
MLKLLGFSSCLAALGLLHASAVVAVSRGQEKTSVVIFL